MSLAGRHAAESRPGWRTWPRGVPRCTKVDVLIVEVTDDGPLGLTAAGALLGGDATAGHRPMDDRRRSAVARAALTQLIGARAGVDPAQVQLDHDAHGRPVLPGSGVHLSVAHSGDFVACAVSDRRIGVDIERSDRAEADEELARRVCSPPERDQLGQPTAPALIRLWTRKEAVSKALGLGLALPFDELDVGGDTPRIGRQKVSSLTVRDLLGGPQGYAAALATEGRWWDMRARLVRAHGSSPIRAG